MSSYTKSATLKNLPPIDDFEYILLEPETSKSAVQKHAYVAGIDKAGNETIIAFIDNEEGAVYRCDHITGEDEANPREANEEPLVKLVGEMSGQTGQVVIKQPEGHWRRYSRWDRLPKGPATQPDAIVRTLPQCGCGGYLGAPMMFDSFAEMLAYFFVVFSDAESVNAKHAAILTGDSCCAI